jgi:adenine specific DNA methylase Mod
MRIQITDKPTIKIDTDRTLTAIEHIQSSSLLMPTNSGHLIQGDNAEIMRCLLKQDIKIDLIYIDPPYLTNLDFKTKEGKFAYSDKFSLDTYLTMLYERLILMKQLLSEKGSIYVHVDYRTSAYVRLIMDEIFGEENFRNEIIWDKGFRGTESKYFYQHAHDNILFYSKSSIFKWNNQYQPYRDTDLRRYNQIDENGKQYALIKRRRTDGTIYYGKTYPNIQGKSINDVISHIPTMASTSSERLGYPTQKPETLLNCLISASSNEGDLVADFFCGSGTTAAAAHKLNRNWICVDMGDEAIKTTKERMLNVDSNFTLSNLNK